MAVCVCVAMVSYTSHGLAWYTSPAATRGEATMRRFILLIAMCTGVQWGFPVGAGEAWDKVEAAVKRGDYAEALAGFRVLADQGHAEAQLNLGFMYANGKGVAEDVAEAMKWWRKAAEQGYASAQHNLGVSYANGEGVAEDDAHPRRRLFAMN
jgi:TPR repeat protein